MKDSSDTIALFIVNVITGESDENVFEDLDYYVLSDELYLVRSELTQSKLYHKIKHRSAAAQLLVGKLDGPPKFKDMNAGSLKWVRDE